VTEATSVAEAVAGTMSPRRAESPRETDGPVSVDEPLLEDAVLEATFSLVRCAHTGPVRHQLPVLSLTVYARSRFAGESGGTWQTRRT
jgi:hypothetical protein